MATTDLRLRALGLLALAFCLAACGGSDPKPAPDSVTKPTKPTQYMETARLFWFNEPRWQAHPDPDARHIVPVKQAGTTWTGDPRDYEKACGTHFLFDDGNVYFGLTPNGERIETPNADERTNYDWLRSNPKRWGAFNSWLLDPAIVKAAADPGQSATDLVRDGDVGDTSGCPDAARKVAALLAKK